jgi:hypothetical protein
LRLLGRSLLVLGIFVVLAAMTPDKETTPVHKFTVGKETTYISGPLDKDGYIDYEAALNDRYARGVTPASNANVLIWKALGPRPEARPILPEFYRRLGIEEPPERGDYFLSLYTHRNNRFKLPPGMKADEILKELTRVAQRPWAAKDHRILDRWLQVNEKPLALVIEATKRPDYYNPMVRPRTEKGPDSMYNAPLPSVQICRELAAALIARAMLRLHEGKLDDAWQDLLASHRLGRLVGCGSSLIESLVGFAIEQTACIGEVAFLDNPQLSSKKALDCLRDVRQLPATSSLAEKLDLSDRFAILDTVMLLDRYGTGYLENLAGEQPAKDQAPKFRLYLEVTDWNPALRTINSCYDRIAAVLRIKDRADREKQIDQLREELKKMKQKIDQKQADQPVNKRVGDMLAVLFIPAFTKAQKAADETEQIQSNLHIAFALASYRGDHEQYPMTLAALAPKYLEQVPGDIYSGKKLIYCRTETGYVLYSVGVNGKDDGGRWRDDDPRGDDVGIRLPLPELKRK